MNRDTAFFQRSIKVVNRFLQTAVVIDDRAFDQVQAVREPPVSRLSSPPTPSTLDPRVPVVLTPDSYERLDFLPDPSPHGLDAKVVMDSFAQLGIVCSVLKRRVEEDPSLPGNATHKLFLVADILVVDWQVHHEDGGDSYQETLDFLKKIVEEGFLDTPRQLRLIIVYTGTQDLLGVSEEIHSCLSQIDGIAPVPDGDFAFQAGAMRIVVLGKPNNKRVINQRCQQVSSDSELSHRAMQEFAVMTAGLVSNVALDSLARVRRATHGILARFGPHLDAAYLAHRSLLDPPQEGNDHLVPLIVSELEAILEDQVPISTDLLSDETISQWLDTRSNHLSLLPGSSLITTEAAARTAIKEICTRGVLKHHEFSIPGEPSLIKKFARNEEASNLVKLTKMIAAEDAENANEDLEILMSFRPQYGDAPPMLTLGTLVSSLEDNQESAYWLCLQPVCDCFLRSGLQQRAFPFLGVEKLNGKFNLVAKIDNSFVRLWCDPKPYKITMFEFKSNSALNSVEGQRENGNFLFHSLTPQKRFRWVAQLKSPQAQRIVQQLASFAARIGLTESEWLRRNGKKTN